MVNWADDIRAAAARIEGYVVKTPVVQLELPGLGPVDFKLEQLQHTGSFKARGAFNSLLSMDVPEAGIVAASGGNHGAAAAYAAKSLGHPAHIFVPEMAGPSKIALIKDQGAELHIVEGAYSNALDAAKAHEAKTGAIQIHAYDAPATVAGQGTLSMEWEAQGLDADTVLIAVGGGGLIAGAMAWMGARRKTVAVEPATSCAMHAAMQAGQPTEVDVSGVAVNSLGAKQIGEIAFGLAQETNLTSVLVTDEAITTAQSWLWRQHRLLVEPGGACALAALLGGAYVPEPGERLAVLICGGNIAPDPLRG